MPLDEAVEAFRADLLRLIQPWGHERKYHETITRFWLSVAAHYLDAEGKDARCTADVANGFVQRFGDKALIYRHYSTEVLAAAHTQWISPDRLPVG
jgi:hypothetical protein